MWMLGCGACSSTIYMTSKYLSVRPGQFRILPALLLSSSFLSITLVSFFYESLHPNAFLLDR